MDKDECGELELRKPKEALKHRDFEIREKVAKALGEIRDARR